jgi:hypothetical protein
MRQPDKLILAVPVGPTDTIAAMREEADFGKFTITYGLEFSLVDARESMKSSASKSTRSLGPSAISTTIFAKSQTRK